MTRNPRTPRSLWIIAVLVGLIAAASIAAFLTTDKKQQQRISATIRTLDPSTITSIEITAPPSTAPQKITDSSQFAAFIESISDLRPVNLSHPNFKDGAITIDLHLPATHFVIEAHQLVEENPNPPTYIYVRKNTSWIGRSTYASEKLTNYLSKYRDK